MDSFDDSFVNNYIADVFAGIITQRELSLSYHETITGVLMDALNRGYTLKDIPEHQFTYEALAQNVYEFSAAKQYQQVRTISAVIREDSLFEEFEVFAKEVFKEYNEVYLETEFNTAIGQAQMARDFRQAEIDSDLFPWVTYRTQQDPNVRDEHRELNGITKRYDDPFWDTYWPKNGWNCRCFTTTSQRGESTDVSRRNLPKAGSKELPEVFAQNPGRTNELFDKKKHPYWKISKGDKALKDNNFNLPRYGE